MSKPERVDSLDALVGLSQRAEPDALSELEARLLARSALVRADEPVLEPRGRALGVRMLSALVAGFVMLGLCAVFFSESAPGSAIEVGRAERPLRLGLRAGDVVIAAPGASLRLLAEDPIERRVSVKEGTALFDVVPLAPGQLFEVETEHARMRVLGTVFSVEVKDRRTIVRVYEGSVYVAGKSLRAGEVWVSSGTLPSNALPSPLAKEGKEHAALRIRSIRRGTGPSPSVSPIPHAEALPLPAAPEPEPLSLPAPSKKLDQVGAARVYAEATRRLYRLGDGASALRLLDTYDLDADAAPLRERASALRVDALLHEGRLEQAAQVARRYVLREPETHTSARMRLIASGLVTAPMPRE